LLHKNSIFFWNVRQISSNAPKKPMFFQKQLDFVWIFVYNKHKFPQERSDLFLKQFAFR